MMELAERDAVGDFIGASVCVPLDVGGIDPRGLAVENGVEATKRTAISEVLQNIDGKLSIALASPPTVQSIES